MAQEPAVCRAGVKRVCITPDLPSYMAGYFHHRIAENVARDLYATALAIESNGHYVVIVATDLIAMTDEICMPAFEKASERWNIPLKNFMACASHTHTGPEIRRGGNNPVNEKYNAKLPSLIDEAVTGALENMFDAVLSIGRTRAPGLAHNRLSRCADGSEIFGRQVEGSKVIGPAGPKDDSVQTIGVYDSNKKLRAVVVDFACHPDLSGGGNATAIDSDWPGEMADYLMRIQGDDIACLFLQGTAGDINHTDNRAETPRWIPGGKSAVARGVAGSALYSLETSETLGEISIGAERRELEIPFYTRDKTLFDLVERLRAKGDKATYFEQNLIKRVDNWDKDGEVDIIPVSCIRIGDIAIAALPGEIFTAWGLEIKRYSPAKYTMVVELASSDGKTGYKPTSDQALRGARGKGAYGALPTLSQKHCPAAGQMMTEAAIEMLHELWP